MRTTRNDSVQASWWDVRWRCTPSRQPHARTSSILYQYSIQLRVKHQTHSTAAGGERGACPIKSSAPMSLVPGCCRSVEATNVQQRLLPAETAGANTAGRRGIRRGHLRLEGASRSQKGSLWTSPSPPRKSCSQGSLRDSGSPSRPPSVRGSSPEPPCCGSAPLLPAAAVLPPGCCPSQSCAA